MEAERSKRAEITLATAKKESQILLSEGERTEAVNFSEGEKQKRINISVGKAQEIELLAEATAQGSRLVAEAINSEGGSKAVQMQLIEQYIDEVQKVYRKANVSVLPESMANIKALFEGSGQLLAPFQQSKQQTKGGK